MAQPCDAEPVVRSFWIGICPGGATEALRICAVRTSFAPAGADPFFRFSSTGCASPACAHFTSPVATALRPCRGFFAECPLRQPNRNPRLTLDDPGGRMAGMRINPNCWFMPWRWSRWTWLLFLPLLFSGYLLSEAPLTRLNNELN